MMRDVDAAPLSPPGIGEEVADRHHHPLSTSVHREEHRRCGDMRVNLNIISSQAQAVEREIVPIGLQTTERAT